MATFGHVYRPPAFAEDDPGSLVALARQAGFGHLVVVADGELVASPVPFVIDDAGTLVRAHLARPNAVWRAAPCRALLIVPVSDAYVSPSWYPAKAEHGKVVPTWNYEVVHVHGELVAHDDAGWVRRQITDLTELNEAQLAPAWAVSDAPDGYIDQLQRGIVGIELRVDRLEGKRKLSQNRDQADQAGVIAGLDATHGRGADHVATAMRSVRDVPGTSRTQRDR